MKKWTILVPMLLIGLGTQFPIYYGSVGWSVPPSIVNFGEWSIFLLFAVLIFPIGTLLMIALGAGIYIFLYPKVSSKIKIAATLVIILCGLGSLYPLMSFNPLTGGLLIMLGYALMLIRPVYSYIEQQRGQQQITRTRTLRRQNTRYAPARPHRPAL